MSAYIPGKSKFKTLQNIGSKIPKHAIGTFQRYTSPDGSVPGYIVIIFDAEPDNTWYIAECSMSPSEYDEEPAVKYTGDIE